MSTAFLVQLAVSAVLVGVMVAVASLARIPRPAPPLDDAGFRQVLAVEFPERRPDAVWLSSDGAVGIARAGDAALIAYRLGDGYVTRDLNWGQLAAAPRTGEGVRLRFGGPAGGTAQVAWPGDAPWPPVRS